MVSAIERMPDLQHQAADSFKDFLGQANDFPSMESLLGALNSAESVKENVIFLQENPSTKTSKEIGEFALVKKIIESNPGYYEQMKGAITTRAQEMQALCCPPGQSQINSFGSVEVALFKVGDGHLSDSEENHEHCPKCGVDMKNGACGSCYKAA